MTSVVAQPLSGASLLMALRSGGYVLVMRHVSSPPAPPTPSEAERDNAQRERQLDAAGRSTAQAMGEAIRKLHIPIGTIWSSPTYRALETLRLMAVGSPTTSPELAEGSQGMHADSDVARASWLRHAVTVAPAAGTDTLIVTHTPNILAAFDKEAANIAAGETLVFRSDGNGMPMLVARIKIGEWTGL
jgi:phosphohistidine phosphatase SixA